MPRFSRWIKDTVLRRTTLVDTDLVALVTDTPVGAAVSVSDLRDQVGGIQSSNGTITDEIVLTVADYAALPVKDPTTVYHLVG